MAQIGELLISLQGDSKSWSSALKTAGDDLRNLTNQAKEAGEDLNKFNARSINVLKGWKNEVGDAYRSVEQSLAPVKQGLVDQGKALDVNQKGMNTLAIETVAASEDMRIFGETLKSTSSALWLMTMGLSQFGRAMTMAFTVPIAGAATLATKTFADWEKGTLKIQSAAEMTREAADEITDSFMEISTQVPLTVTELQKAGFAAAQAGVTGEKAITNFAEAAVKLSKVGGDAFRDLPIEQLANRLAMLAKAFDESGENMENVEKIASSLLVVAKAVPGGLGEIMEGMRRAAPFAVQLGLSLADTTAIIGTLIAVAVPAARAGTEFGRALLDMLKNAEGVEQALGLVRNELKATLASTEATKEVFKLTSDEVKNLTERMDTDMMGVLDELVRRYGYIESGTKAAQHAMDIFGGVGLKAILPLIQNYDLFKDLQARANQEMETGALLAAEFDIQANSLSGTMTVFSNSLKALAYVVGKDLAPYINYFLKTFTEGLRKLVAGWQSLNPHIKLAIFLIGGLLAVIGPLALILNTLFLDPISGLVTFITFLTKATAQLALQTGVASSAGVATNFFAFSLTNAATAAGVLIKGLSILILRLVTILGIVGLVGVALYALGKALGIKIKLPEMPKIALPKYKGATLPKVIGGETGEELAEADKKAAKKKEKELARELRDKRKARKKELRIIDDGIDEYEKIRNAETKGRQKLVDEQKDALDQRRELWEDENRIEQEKIRIQGETLETVKKTLKESKKTLNELKKTYDREVDTAEGRVDYAEMNLDAAQDALKREKILGRDEFDASFRAAEARVKAMEDVVWIAKMAKIDIDRAYQEQVAAQEDIVDANQEQVDLQTDALDNLRDVLAERRAIVDKEIDVLNDELKIRQDALTATREATREKLDLLREERDTRQEAWDDEIEIIQDRLDDARDQADAIADLPIQELPDVAGSWQELNDELENQFEEMQKTIGASLGMGVGLTSGGLLDNYKEAWEGAKEIAEREGGNTGVIYVKAMYDGMAKKIRQLLDPYNELWLNFLFGEGTWNELDAKAGKEGKSLVEYLWDGFISKIKEIPEKIKASIEKAFIQPFRDAFPLFFTTGKEGGEKTKEGLAKGGEGAEQTGSLIIRNFVKGLKFWGGVYTVIGDIRKAIWENLGSMAGNAWDWGYNLAKSFRNGMESAGKWIESTVVDISSKIKNWWESLSPPKEGPLKNIDKWGENLVKTYADSMTKGIPYLERAIGDVSGGMGASFAGGASAAISTDRTATTEVAPTGATINKNYYIQPGQMIATRGEVRSFVKLLKEYDQFEEDR